MCAHTIVKQITVYDIERLPLPPGIKENLKSYALTNYSTLLRHPGGAPQYKSLKKRHKFRAKTIQTPADAAKTDCVSVSRKSCVIAWKNDPIIILTEVFTCNLFNKNPKFQRDKHLFFEDCSDEIVIYNIENIVVHINCCRGIWIHSIFFKRSQVRTKKIFFSHGSLKQFTFSKR